jgi:hypothetical protein
MVFGGARSVGVLLPKVAISVMMIAIYGTEMTTEWTLSVRRGVV